MQLTIDPQVVEELKAKDARLAQVIEHLPVPVRKQSPDLFEAIISSIVSQQISTRAAETIMQRMVDQIVKITPESIISLEIDDIQAFGMSFRKAGYIAGVARQVVAGKLNLDELSSLSDETVVKHLTKLSGIGPWTAEMLLIFSLGREDVLSISDLGIQRGVERVYGSGFVNQKSLLQLRERFSPHGTAAGLYFWHVAGLSPTDWADLDQSLFR